MGKIIFVKNNYWCTPDYIYKYLNRIFNFKCDLAANRNNSKCEKFLTDALNNLDKWEDWNFCNPPFSRGNLPKFTRVAYEQSLEGRNTVMITPLDTCKWAKDWVWNKCQVWIPNERIRFQMKGRESSPSKGSMILIYSKSYAKIIKSVSIRERKVQNGNN